MVCVIKNKYSSYIILKQLVFNEMTLENFKSHNLYIKKINKLKKNCAISA